MNLCNSTAVFLYMYILKKKPSLLELLVKTCFLLREQNKVILQGSSHLKGF